MEFSSAPDLVREEFRRFRKMFRLVQFGAALPQLRYCRTPIIKTASLAKALLATRSFMSRTSEVMESRLKAKDTIPDNFHLVYRGGMDSYMHLAHSSSAILAFLSVGVIYRSFYIEEEPIVFPIEFKGLIGVQNYGQLAIMYGTFFCMLYLLRQIGSRYVLRMYYDPSTKTYSAVQLGILPTITTKYEFPAGTLKRQTQRYLLPWRNGVYDSNGTKLLLYEAGFRTSSAFDGLFRD